MESEPLYKLKAEFFKTLAHPARIRILELLVERDRSVGELLSSDVGLESSNLSQQLGVLRRAGVVAARRDGNAMIYSMPHPISPSCWRWHARCWPGCSATGWRC